MSEQEVIPQESIEPKIKTIKEVAEEYINNLGLTNAAKSNTIGIYTRAIKIAVEYFRPMRPINSITLPQTGKFFCSNQLLKLPNGQPRADLTVRQIKRVFRQCLEFALAKGWIDVPLPIPKAELGHARTKSPSLQTESPEPVTTDTQS